MPVKAPPAARGAAGKTCSPLRAAIAHEWLVQYAGSERVVEQILQLFPDARLMTTLRDNQRLPPSIRCSETSLLQAIPGAVSHHEWFLPLMPLDWRLRRPIDDVDVVISSSHACAKAVRVGPGIPHVCYCHTPMRYAWSFQSEAGRFPPAVRPVARQMMAGFRWWDRQTAQKVDMFIANSSSVAARIERSYGRRAIVVHPPVRTDFFTPAGRRGDFYLYVGRLTGYKRPDLVVEAFRGLRHQLVVVGAGPLRRELERSAPENVSFRGSVDDDELRRLYRECKAFVYPVDEDFGITMVEAQACGTPVIALNSGGALDIVAHGETGWLIPRQEIAEVRKAIEVVARRKFDAEQVSQSAQRFSTHQFRTAFLYAVLTAVEARGSRTAAT